MTKLPSRLRRHLSYANLMASIAVFVALGGVGYAATSINGNKIIKNSVGAGKLKNGTLTSAQVKANGLTGSVIEEASLGTVPAAKSAETADRAVSAGSAEDAETLDGLTAQQLQVTCPAETGLYGGMCWDEEPRPATNWIAASVDCGEAGGRLPSLSELIAYVLQPGEQVSGHNWSGDAGDFNGPSGEERAFTRDETTNSLSPSPTGLGYRCLFYRVN